MNEGLRSQFLSYRSVFAKLVEDDPDFLKKELFQIQGQSLDRYKELCEELKKSYKSQNSNKGKILEKLTKFLMLQNRMYEVITNLRDNSNEIDLLLKLNDLGEAESKVLPQFMVDNPTFILECKNYNRKIDVTWIGKFYNLLKMRDLKLGVIFSYDTVKGIGEWDSSKGLIKKIYLKDKIIILNFFNEDFNKIADGKETIISSLSKKHDNLVFMTDLDKHRSKHPAED